DINLLLQRLAATANGLPQQGAAATLPPPAWPSRTDEGATHPPSMGHPIGEPRVDSGVGTGPGEHPLARRLQRVQEMASELTGALAHSQEGLDAAAAATEETQRMAGASVALAHEVLASVQQAADLLARAHRALAPTTPVVPATPGEGGAPVSFLGLGADVGVAAPGLTGQYQLSPNGELVETGAPGTADTLAGSEPAAAPGGADGAAAGTPLPDGPALHAALDALREAIASQERGASTLTQDLGLISRHVRGIDGHVAWARQAVDAVRRNAERLQATATGAGPLLADDTGAMAPPSAEAPSRGPTTSRPLTDGPRSYPSMPPSSFEPPASAAGEGHEPDRAPLE
ncbi:MAG TPA: hypothetical protein VET66_11945, partial [Steroidobacteraceae bacterium]|nr:hypothetical protein [Steroidobacteraceae bacterium]